MSLGGMIVIRPTRKVFVGPSRRARDDMYRKIGGRTCGMKYWLLGSYAIIAVNAVVCIYSFSHHVPTVLQSHATCSSSPGYHTLRPFTPDIHKFVTQRCPDTKGFSLDHFLSLLFLLRLALGFLLRSHALLQLELHVMLRLQRPNLLLDILIVFNGF